MNRIAEPVRTGCRRLLAVVLFATAALAVACESSSTVSTGPTPVKCQVSLGSTSMMDAGGGASSVSVTTQPECAWEATTSANWISGLSPASGQGNGTVAFRVAANDGATARDGNIVINGQSAVVSQRAPCRYTLTPANQNVSANGAAGSVTLATSSECAWTASTDATWITLTPPASGSGNATITFTAARNTGDVRTGSITIAGQRATITQAAGPSACNATINPTSQNIGAAGGSGQTISVTVPNTCAWTAVSNVSWIVVTGGASETGPSVVTFSVAANTGAARTGTLTVAGRVFTVTQAAGTAPPPACSYTIAPGNQNLPAAGGPGTVNVTTTAGCTWTASSGAPWVVITSGATGSGNGVVGFTVSPNTGAARSATLTIAGHPFTVTQDAVAAPPPCTYTIAPQSQNVDANANTGSVAVTAGNGCAWTAVSNAPWLTVTAGATGAGNGTVGFSVAANAGALRSGTITIAGQTFTVTQAAFVAPCAYTIAPGNQNFPVLGGTGTVNVTTSATCTWTASSAAPWVTITSGATGTGNGTVGFAVAANLGAQRSTTLTIGGQTFTVTQDAVLGPLAQR